MRSICFYFKVHQPVRLRTYRFFDIGKRHFYYDDYQNRMMMQRVSEHCYLPMNELLMKQIAKYGDKIKFSFSFSGITVEQMDYYVPEALESFEKLVATGNVELISETYSHSLASLANKEAFKKQVVEHKKLIKDVFGVVTKTFNNTDLIYSDSIGSDVAEMGFDLMVTEGAKHVLGWKSPNYLYVNAINPKLKLFLRNYKMSDALSLKFGTEMKSVEDFVNMLKETPQNEEVVNVLVDYETFGECYNASTGIFDFMNSLPEAIFNNTDFQFAKPHDLIKELQPLGTFDAPIPLSCRDEERDLSPWLGNDMQDNAFKTMYDYGQKMRRVHDEDILNDWKMLQASENYINMCTKTNTGSPYDAYINFMNILTDFRQRVDTELAAKK